MEKITAVFANNTYFRKYQHNMPNLMGDAILITCEHVSV